MITSSNYDDVRGDKISYKYTDRNHLRRPYFQNGSSDEA